MIDEANMLLTLYTILPYHLELVRGMTWLALPILPAMGVQT